MATNGYWEFYDDQTSDMFDRLSYTDLSGSEVCVATQPDLAAQVHEIRRTCGANTEIKVYAKAGMALA